MLDLDQAMGVAPRSRKIRGARSPRCALPTPGRNPYLVTTPRVGPRRPQPARFPPLPNTNAPVRIAPCMPVLHKAARAGASVLWATIFSVPDRNRTLAAPVSRAEASTPIRQSSSAKSFHGTVTLTPLTRLFRQVRNCVSDVSRSRTITHRITMGQRKRVVSGVMNCGRNGVSNRMPKQNKVLRLHGALHSHNPW